MKRRALFILVTVASVYCLFELGCLGALEYLRRFKGMKYELRIEQLARKIKEDKETIVGVLSGRLEPAKVFDKDLGWVTPKYRRLPGVAITNGIRDEKEYSLKKTPGFFRMLAFGDSYTYSDACSNQSSWEHFLSQRGNVEALNFGVPGYGVDQAYLRYLREGRQYETNVVLIGVMSENICRHVNTFRYFYTPVLWTYSKPRFYLEGDRLVLQENYFRSEQDIFKLLSAPEQTLRELGTRDYYYRHRFYERGPLDLLPSVRLWKVLAAVYSEQINGIYHGDVYNTNSEAFRVTTKILDAFIADVQKSGAVPVVLVFPHDVDIVRWRAGRPKSYAPLLDYLKKQQYRFIDVMDGFDKYCSSCEVDNLIRIHYSPLGNSLVARGIEDYFMQNFRH